MANETSKGPVRIWRARTHTYIPLERGELELLRQYAQHNKKRVSDLLREKIEPLLSDCRSLFPERTKDLERRGLL